MTHTADPPDQHAQVLMVAYYYPPVDNTGTRRTVKFARYLPGFGYQPLVLTTRGRGTLPDDAAQEIYRVDDLAGLFKRAYRAHRLRDVPPEQRASIAALGADNPIERLRAAWSIPDHQIIWYPSAVRLGLEILRRHAVRLLYSTSPPETDHLIALALKRASGLPWVADFRDGWLFEPLIPHRATSPLRRRIETRLERMVIEQADQVVVASGAMRDDMARRYPQAAGKLSLITNGYDSADFAGLTRQRTQRDRFRLVHTGTFSIARWNSSLQGLLAALRALQGEQIMRDLEIVLVGDTTPDERAAIEQAGLRERFVLTGRVSYREALQQQIDADVLLLVVGAATVSYSSNKLFEYLATGRPVLALANPASVAGLVADLGAGFVVEPDNVPGIQRALHTLHAQWQAGLLPTRVSPGARQFDRRELTRRLAEIFDSLTGERRE